ncbi:phospholipase D-like domain-containing protein [Anaerolineales bacterium HSG24]|nr:phospholipase D-like domain-containing protein [Anaerolineales bacterium HSG24]
MTKIETCSKSLKKAFSWLTEYVKNNKDADIWNVRTAQLFYALSIISSPTVEEYKRAAASEGFWMPLVDIVEFSEDMYYLHFMGLSEYNEFKDGVDDLVSNCQNTKGYIANDHPSSSRLLVAIAPQSDTTKLAINFLVAEYIRKSQSHWKHDLTDIAKSMLVLQELDFFAYKQELEIMSQIISKTQRADGSLCSIDEDDDTPNFQGTCFAVIALSRMNSHNSIVEKAIKYLKNCQDKNGNWRNFYNRELDSYNTALAIITLNEVGEGPKISQAQFEWQQKLALQQMNTSQPHFIHTSPIFNNAIHIKQIYDTTLEMMQRAQHRIRICSLYFDMLYEHVIDLAVRDNIVFSIIVRPRADIKGRRDRIAKNVLDLLKVSTKGGVRTNPIVHARMMIIDDKEVLISTADLTRDQLFDEYNAGIWTKNLDVIEKAIEFFDNVWNDSDKLN